MILKVEKMSYDDWKQTDQIGEQMAAYEAKHAALTAQIRAELIMSDYVKEIECDASFDADCNAAITAGYLLGVDGPSVLHGYAVRWLDNHAAKLATQRLQGQHD